MRRQAPVRPRLGRGHRADRGVRGVGLQGGALHRSARRRPGDPAHLPASPRGDGGGRPARLPRDRSRGERALRPRRVSAGNVQFLVEKQLRPLGVLAADDGSSPSPRSPTRCWRSSSGSRWCPSGQSSRSPRCSSPCSSRRWCWPSWPEFVALDVWLFFIHGIGAGVREAVYQPLLLVLFFGLVVLATAFHEIGHASACRYGGARPGVLGAGIYVVWPVFYCDVTDAYRLSKAGPAAHRPGRGVLQPRVRPDRGRRLLRHRVRADPARGAASALRGPQQLLPLLRLDGYYIMSDLTGVPDILTRIRPILRSLVPGRKSEDKVERAQAVGAASWSAATCSR